MGSKLFRPAGLWAIFLLCVTLLTVGCGVDREPTLPETTVANLPGEDLAGPCTYALRLAQGPVVTPGQPPTQIPQTAVLVIFERGDSSNLFKDPTVIATAQQLHIGLMYAYECDAASFNDLQPNATAGPGRALFQAFNQFAISLNHPELASANAFLAGFSAGGFLAITTALEFPARVLGTIPYAPGSSHGNVAALPVSSATAQIPSLILVSATDIAAGDQLPFFLFQRGWAQGAPWGFASQHALNHCCVDSIAPILNPWVTAIASNYTNSGANGLLALLPHIAPVSPTVAFQIAVDGSFDPVGYQDFYFGSYSLLPSTAGGPFEAWLPDPDVTQAWVTWITNSDGN